MEKINMDGSNAIFIVMPIIVLIALFTAIALPVMADIAAARRLRQAGPAATGRAGRLTEQPAGLGQPAPRQVPDGRP
jgi:hypothetical protein